MTRLLVFLTVGGCGLFGGDDDAPPVFVDDTGGENDSGGDTPDPGLQETRLRVGAIFRYNATTGLPGPWLDESNGDNTSAIEFIVGDDQYDGTNGLFCIVNVPISETGARLRTDLDDGQFWGVDLQVSLDDVTTNCDEAQFLELWDFYGGNLVEYLTTNRDGSPVEWSVIVEEPSADAVAWLTGGGSTIPEEEVVGGEIRLSDRWPQARVDSIAARAVETDADGVLLTDDKGDNLPIPLEDVFQNPGIKEGRYQFIGFRYVQVTSP